MFAVCRALISTSATNEALGTTGTMFREASSSDVRASTS